jgi:RNA polymerase sigma-70 factor (ECF subfamily)
MTEIEDRLLIRAFLLTHSEAVFNRLYRKHTKALYKISYRLLDNDLHGAEDIVQDAWVRAIMALHTFKWQSSFKTWLTGIAINCVREYSRQNKPAGMFTGDNEIAGNENTAVKLDVKRAIATLPAGYREILLLHDIQGFTHKEIASILNITEGTSKSQLFNARNAFKKLIS